MGEIYNWKCSKCGECCIRTVGDTGLGKYGVFLLPNERFMFPEQYVKPLFGLGVKGKARPRPKYIYAYQNISSPCVWYMEELHECLIYDKRPLACHVFPLSQHGSSVQLHRECPAVAELIPENVRIKGTQIKGFTEELKVLRKLESYFIHVFVLNPHNEDVQHCWAYDLNKNKWVIWTDEELLRFLETIRKKVKPL